MVIDLPKEAGQVPDLQQGDVRETSNIGLSPTITDFTNSQHTHADAAGGGATTHGAGDGSDHADVASNNTHRADNSQAHSDYPINTGDTITGALTFDDGVADSPAIVQINGSDHTVTFVCQNTSGDLHISTSTGGIELAPGDNTVDVGTSKISGVVDPTTNQEAATKKYVDDQQHLTNKTSYWSAAGIAVQGPGTIAAQTGSYLDEADTNEAYLPVNLPQGAVVTIVEAIGAVNSQIVWTLYRKTGSGLGDVMASAGVGLGPDTSISNATIANQTYSYFIRFINMDGRIDRVEIAYTTDYD